MKPPPIFAPIPAAQVSRQVNRRINRGVESHDEKMRRKNLQLYELRRARFERDHPELAAKHKPGDIPDTPIHPVAAARQAPAKATFLDDLGMKPNNDR